MRYMGNALPPCASEDDSAAPPGFVPLDISSLSKSQFNMLQELGSRRISTTNSDDSRTKTVKTEKKSDDSEDEDEGFGVKIPSVLAEDESDVD